MDLLAKDLLRRVIIKLWHVVLKDFYQNLLKVTSRLSKDKHKM